MSKTVQIDLSGDRLISIAADMVDEHNYIGALKMLNKNAEITGNDEDSYMLYAEIFDDMGLYERSIHNWFKYMDIADYSELSECYEGLAVGYMNLGDDHFSAYYYNKLLLESDDVDADTREQIVRDFLSADENPLKFVWPPEIADVSDVLAEGVELMKQGEYAKAYKKFSGVAEGNPKWVTARNYMAMCLIVQDRNEQAEQECNYVLEKCPDNIQALTTLAAVKTEAGKPEEAKKITEKLLSLDISDADDIYKIATVCCENKFHAAAYDLFCKMESEYAYDLNILYFKAVSAFNSEKYDESFEAFDKLLTIYPDAVTAQYWYGVARTLREEGKWQELSYFYTLPQPLKQSSLKMLAAYIKLPKRQAEKLADDLNISGPIKWCFDESTPANSEELQIVAAQSAVKAKMDDYIRDLLLHPTVSDRIKIDLLTSLCERNEDNAFGVVVCNVYRRVNMRRLNISAARRVYFVRAYARLVAHFSIIDDDYGERFASASEKIYVELQEGGRLDAAKDAEALTAVIFAESGVTDAGVTKENLCAFFDVSQERIDKIRGDKN